MTRQQNSSFGTQLRRLRERAGLTQADLAERAGLTTQAISALERGARRQPYPHTVNAIAAALGLSPEERAGLIGARFAEPLEPPLVLPAPVVSAQHNLPAQVSSFIGRVVELQELGALLRSYRLVTLTGAGGSGKTRLALAATDAVAPAFADGVRLVELAGFSDPAFLPDAVARALAIHQEPGMDLAAAIITFLRSRHMLVLLDNCEHLIDPCAQFVEQVLRECPQVHFCATSREVLRLAGERVYPVPTLPAPDPAALVGAEELSLYDAVRLFEERAAAQLPDFRLTAENAHAIATICWRLDGIPLAIELAAARIRSLPPQQLAERLSRSLSLLTGGSRTAPARHQTLRGALDWSYNLLEPVERTLFLRLSIFSGGWDLEAADLVGANFDAATPPVADLLTQLVDQSLVQVEWSGSTGAFRYRMLEPVRQYALQLLEDSGELNMIRSRHAAVYLDLAERAQPELRRGGQIAWITRLSLEHDNIRAALSWALRAGEIGVAARIGWCIWPFWWIRAYQAEGRRWLEQILAREAELAPSVALRALMALTAMSYGTGDMVQVARYMEDMEIRVAALGGDVHGESYVVMTRGLLALDRGDLVPAERELAACVPLLDACGEAGIAAQMRVFRGTALLLNGDTAGAAECFNAGLTAGRALGDRLAISNALFSLAQLALITEQYALAVTHLRAGIPIAQEMGDQTGIAFIIEGMAVVAARQGDDLRAAQLFGVAEGLRGRIGLRGHTYYGAYRVLFEQVDAELRTRLDPQIRAMYWDAGRGLSIAQAIALLHDDGVH